MNRDKYAISGIMPHVQKTSGGIAFRIYVVSNDDESARLKSDASMTPLRRENILSEFDRLPHSFSAVPHQFVHDESLFFEEDGNQ